MSLPQPTMCLGHFVEQPPFITNNWKAFQAYQDRDYAKYVKVHAGIATVVNDSAVIRSPLIRPIPDGFYRFADDDMLYDCTVEITGAWGAYSYYREKSFPDVETIRPRFDKIVRSELVPMVTVRKLIDFLNHVRYQHAGDTDSCQVGIEGSVMSCVRDSNLWCDIECQIPINVGCGHFHANKLRLVLIDMLRYEHVLMGMDFDVGPEIKMPLVVWSPQLEWTGCGLIKSSN